MRKFLIITDTGQYIEMAEDMDEALENSWNNHYGYDHIQAIVKIEEE